MNWASDLVKLISGLELSPNYAIIYLLFVLTVIGFIVWGYYYAVFRKGARELKNITWFSLKDTAKYTLLTVATIVIVGGLMFSYDFLLDKLVNIIIQNAG